MWHFAYSCHVLLLRVIGFRDTAFGVTVRRRCCLRIHATVPHLDLLCAACRRGGTRYVAALHTVDLLLLFAKHRHKSLPKVLADSDDGALSTQRLMSPCGPAGPEVWHSGTAFEERQACNTVPGSGAFVLDTYQPVGTMRPMNAKQSTSSPPVGAREKLLSAALKMIRERGYGATSVDALCAAAGVTKGAFFHHFKSKEALGVAAAAHWSDTTGQLFAQAPYHNHADPLQRVLAYIDFRAGLLDGPLAEITCLAGTMVQESYQSSDTIREACNASIADHAATLEADIAAALHTQAVLQGAFILAKASGDTSVAVESTAHLKRYFELLFGCSSSLEAVPDQSSTPTKGHTP
jgi:TetR/AcrR family transcriptional regulator, transcriptional repressor for nem operon